MKPLWKYTIGLIIEVVVKILQTLTDQDNPVIRTKKKREKPKEEEPQ